jgi:hypothetical protein
VASKRQIDANRSNAGKSTGPRTAEGKRKASMNSLKHGLSSVDGTAVLPTENPKEYAAHREKWWASRKPVGVEEGELTDMAADLSWRLRRCSKIEHGILVLGVAGYQEHFWTELQRIVEWTVADVVRVAKQELSPEAVGRLINREALEGAQRVIDDAVDANDSDEARLASGWIEDVNGPNGLPKLSRYETALWNRLAQVLARLDEVQSKRLKCEEESV